MQMAALCAGVILVIRQDVSPGSMMACSIIMGRLLLPFEQMVDGWRQWVVAATAWKKLQSLLVEEVPPRDRTPTPLPHGPLIVEGLVYAPPGADMPIIKGVSFTLEPGEVLGIAGASAAGKSTLARLITGVLKPTAGGVYLDGHSTYVWERGSFGRAVGYLPQSVSLIEGTIRENIARMEACDPKAVIAAARLAGVHDMIGRLPFGYDTDVAENGHMLSGGQRQRIGLARALYGNPRLLVLDEPNANLDAEGEAALLRAIAHAKSEGAIVVIIAHRASVMQAADRLIVIENGRIAQDGARGEQPASLVSSRPRLTTVPA
jgi:ATP-binding cassette subfamily C protein